MRLIFDKYTQQKIKREWENQVCVSFLDAWCAGKKIHIWPVIDSTKQYADYPQDSGITVWCSHEDVDLLDNGQIAVANGKTYFSGPTTKWRCGCGTSVSFEDKKIDLSLEKIHRIAQKLSPLTNIQDALKQNK